MLPLPPMFASSFHLIHFVMDDPPAPLKQRKWSDFCLRLSTSFTAASLFCSFFPEIDSQRPDVIVDFCPAVLLPVSRVTCFRAGPDGRAAAAVVVAAAAATTATETAATTPTAAATATCTAAAAP